MNTTSWRWSVVAIAALAIFRAGAAPATVIDFTGGTITQWDGTTAGTNNTFYLESVDYYVENGFKLDFIGGETVDNEFEAIVGDYYRAGNDVVHGHWATGNFGGLTEIVVTSTDGQPFDLNYFILTSNTALGGGPAVGTEEVYINALDDSGSVTYSQRLPTDGWGFAGSNPQIFLGSEFDSVYGFSFTAANTVDCFGMDNFYINEPAPVPEPGTIVLLGSGMLGLVTLLRRRRQGR